MNKDESQAFERELGRIQALIGALENLADPQAREPAKELLQVVLDLHGTGLARLLELVSEAEEAGQKLLNALAKDEQVRALLLLHGVHPQDLESRVRKAVDTMRPFLGTQGIQIELSSVAEGKVRLRLQGNWQGQQLATEALRRELEEAIFEAAPDAAGIEIEGLVEPAARPREIFVPVSSIPRRNKQGASAAGT